jgi:hypothetical protein
MFIIIMPKFTSGQIVSFAYNGQPITIKVDEISDGNYVDAQMKQKKQD